MEEAYIQMCPKCKSYHTGVYKTCTVCDSPLRPAGDILGRQDLIATIIGFGIVLFVFLGTSVIIQAFGQN